MAKFYQISPITPLTIESNSELDSKVDKIPGKGLSTKDFTKNYRNKLDNVNAGAEVNVNADWNAVSGDAVILNKPSDITDLSLHSLTEFSDYLNVIADVSGTTLTVGPGLAYYYNPAGNVGYLENTGVLIETDPVFSFSPAASITQTQIDTWDAGALGGTVTSFSAGDLSPLFTTSEANPTTTPTLTFALSNAGANTYFGNATGSPATPSYTLAGALTKVDDTNITLTLGGAPTTSLLAATSLTLGWTGQLAVTRGGLGLSSTAQGDLYYGSASNVISALSKDTNATRYLSNTGTSNNPAWAQVNLANGVTGDLPFANLTQIAGLSVLGVTGSSTADVAAITAASDHQILRRSGSTLSFGSIDLSQANATTNQLPVSKGGTGAATFTNNRVLTGNGTSAIVDEANLTFDGTTLSTLTNSNSQTNNIVIQNASSGSSAAGMLRFWNNASTAANRGFLVQLPSSAFTSPYGGSATYWLYENANQIWATNNAARMLLNATGLYIGAATTPSERLHVSGNAYVTGNISAGVQPALQKLHISGKSYLTDDVGIGVNPATARLHVSGTANATLLVESSNTTGAAFQVKNTSVGGGWFQFSTAGSANFWPAGSFLGYDVNASANRFWVDPTGNFGIGGMNALSAKLHVRGAGATSSTDSLIVENSSGTDYFKLNDAGQLYLGSSTPNAAAIFQADSTTQGFLPPRGTTAQKNAIASPPEGLCFYDTTTHKLCVYDGTVWQDCF